VLLYSGRYDEAFSSLTQTDIELKRMGLKREHLQASLRLCICLLVEGKQAETMRRLQEISALLTNDPGYTYLVLLELQRQPKLQRFIKTSVALQDLRVLLQIEAKPQEEKPRSIVTSPPSSPRQRITLLALGEPMVLLDEKPIHRWRMARSLELFFLLLDGARPMRTEQIIDALWTDADDRAAQTVHLAVHHLRQVLGSSSLISHAGTYKLNLSTLYGEIYYDVRAFQAYQIKAKQALAQGDDAGARTALMHMVDLYRGDYLQSFYTNWPTFRRDELRSILLDARQHLAQIAWRAEQFDESILHWKQILAIDNCLESAHHGLMICYVHLGKREAALRQYQRCKETLQAELAVQPGTSIQRLYQHLLHSPDRGELKKEYLTLMDPPSFSPQQF
jgi:two-component SAPR family response regulator